MAQQKKVAKDKKLKKKWISILANKEFNNQEIGETYVSETEECIGRTIRVNLMTLTKDPKKQNFNAYFKITKVNASKAESELWGYELQVAQLKKITKKSKSKVEDSFIYETKDNKKMILKPILITKSLTYRSCRQDLRKQTRAFLTDYTKNLDSSKLFQDIINNKLQRDLKNNAKKIVPLV